jgi:hypothetical protein
LRLTSNLLLLHLESAALSLDRLLQANDRGALLLEGPLLIRVRDAEGYQLPIEPRDLGVPLLQRLLRPLASGALPLERRPGVSKGGTLLLELTLGLLAGGTLLPKLFLHCGERGDLGGEGGLQFLGLLGPLLGLLGPLLGLPCLLLGPALLGQRLQEPRADLLVLGPDRRHLRLPIGRHGAHLLQIPPRLLQLLILVNEGCANPLDGGGTRCSLPLLLQELVAQGLRPVRQPAVLGPQGLRERVEGVTLFPELAELGTHLVEGTVLVAGAVLELLLPTNRNQ